jgi:hypothetical protein
MLDSKMEREDMEIKRGKLMKIIADKCYEAKRKNL